MAASIRDIKARVVATKKTAQITKAMNMVSASKLKGAQKSTESFRPYMRRVEEIISSVASSGEKLEHPLFEERVVLNTCYVLITCDRGLAGPFNVNVCKLLMNEIKENQNNFIVPLGTKAYAFAKSKKLNLLKDEIFNLPDDVPFENILSLIDNLVNGYLEKKFDKVVLVFNHFVNTLKIEPSLKTILPIKKDFEENNDKMAINYEYDESIESILDTILPLYLENLVYGIILDSKASEHASRMTAMSNATDNAEDVISKLELVYNRARQAAITLELTDIIGGSNAINGG